MGEKAKAGLVNEKQNSVKSRRLSWPVHCLLHEEIKLVVLQVFVLLKILSAVYVRIRV
ncbi:hypothetical protein UNDKW_3933 [Undibacterium sp. KW1]|nr:hypothetical protein UNDKW_3933 [Undibacterium sp. KW1]